MAIPPTFAQEGAITGSGARTSQAVASELAKAGVKAAATTALASVGASVTTPVSVTLTASLLTSAGASSVVPVAGWIVAGALVTAAGVTAIVGKYASSGRQLALVFAEKHFGSEGLAFAREYADAAQRSTAKIQSRIISLQTRISRYERWGKTIRRQVRVGKLKDKLNANLVVLEQRAQVPDAAPIAHEPQTLPAVVEEKAMRKQATQSYVLPAVVIGSAVILGAVLLWRSN